jgi:hypothetical protein
MDRGCQTTVNKICIGISFRIKSVSMINKLMINSEINDNPLNSYKALRS